MNSSYHERIEEQEKESNDRRFIGVNGDKIIWVLIIVLLIACIFLVQTTNGQQEWFLANGY